MSSRYHDSDCDYSVDAAPYVLGALEESESYREHLTECATCSSQVAELQLVVDTLPTSVPQVTAPAALRHRVLASVRSEAELLNAAGSHIDRAPRRLERWRSRRISLAGAAVAIAVTVAAAVAITTGLSPGAHERVTSAQVAPSIRGAHASLRQTGARAELEVSDMPQPPAGDIYEVWLSRRSASPQPTDALFGVTSSGRGSVNVPGSLHGVQEVLVTSEPRGGSLHPTTPAVLHVVLSA